MCLLSMCFDIVASSTQRQGALATYWSSILQQRPQDLTVFMSTLVAAPIIVPFDGASQSFSSSAYNSASFPPALACYPGLNSSQLAQVNAIEVPVFGLASATSATEFDDSCYPDRPVYGVLDILHLRLPFPDSRKGIFKQAVVLDRSVSARAVIHAGEILSALPAKGSLTSVSAPETDPKQFGTFNHLNHVVLSYLQSIPDVNVAIALATYVLGSDSIPPVNGSTLAQSLDSIPSLEVAIFGSILPADISSTVSSFTTSSGGLFFGSDLSASLRNKFHPVVWADSAIAPLVAHDTLDATLNSTWAEAAKAIDNNIVISVKQITDSLSSTGKLTPT